MADPTGGCCAPARHDECCAGDCQLSHVVEGITDQESASCHSLGAAASSPSPPPPRLSSSSWGFEVDLGYVTQGKGEVHLRRALYMYVCIAFVVDFELEIVWSLGLNTYFLGSSWLDRRHETILF